MIGNMAMWSNKHFTQSHGILPLFLVNLVDALGVFDRQCGFLLVETASLYIKLTGLELFMQIEMPGNSYRSACLCLPTFKMYATISG